MDAVYLKVIGIIFIAVALIIGISTLITMRNSWRMGITQGQNSELVINGLFRYGRNPYFLSYYLLFLGVFMIYPTALFLIFYIPFAILTHLMVIEEEGYLLKQHGESYLKYKNSVKRYFIF